MEAQFRIEYGTSVDDFGDSIYAAGMDLSGSDISERAKSVERSNKMLNKRREAIEELSAILWGFTAKETISILNEFFPE